MSILDDDDHPTRLGRYHDPGTGRALFRSGRIGQVGGRPARTFHCNFRGITVAQGGSDRGAAAADYLAREGDYDDRTDLEALAGDTAAMREALAAIDAGCRVRRGPTAERVRIATVAELPADSTPDSRRRVAEALVVLWQDRGHLAVVAVHADATTQPHLHILATARPVRRDSDNDSGWAVDRDPARVPLRGKAATRAARSEVAEIINRFCRPAVEFHPGRLGDTGISRPAKKRLPERAFRRAQVDHPEVAGAVAWNRAAEAGDQVELDTFRLDREQAASAAAARAEARRTAVANRRAARSAEAGIAQRGRRKAAGPGPAARIASVAEAVAAALAHPPGKPPSETARTAATDLARKVGQVLPDGWDRDAGTAGAAVRVLKMLQAAQRDGAIAAVRSVAHHRDDLQDQAALAPDAVKRGLWEIEQDNKHLSKIAECEVESLRAKLAETEAEAARARAEADAVEKYKDAQSLTELIKKLRNNIPAAPSPTTPVTPGSGKRAIWPSDREAVQNGHAGCQVR